MATQADVRRIAMSLDGVEEGSDPFAFSVANKGKAKGFAWVWKERVVPKKPRVPNPGVLAVRVANLAQTSLATDMVFSDGWDAELGTVTGTVGDGLKVTLKVPV